MLRIGDPIWITLVRIESEEMLDLLKIEKTPSSLANRCLRPLGHLSAKKTSLFSDIYEHLGIFTDRPTLDPTRSPYFTQKDVPKITSLLNVFSFFMKRLS